MVANLTVIDTRSQTTGSPGFSPSSCNPNGHCGNGLEKIYPTTAVRYGFMNYIGEFRYAPGMLFGCGAKVVIQTTRGTEVGQMVSLTCTGCDKSVKRTQMLDYVKNSGPDFYRLKSGRILRQATAQDIEEDRRINDGAREKMRRAKQLAREMNLEMKFVACEHLFGGERVVLHFMSEARVDFREFVRQLAHEFHTRIEMHQVGARDEARLVADYEICGRECCCKNFLKTLRPVNMRMAKLQKATLDPSKVSGRCGRLRCCLRYEHEGYEELDKKLPRVGNRVKTDRGIGTVRDRQVLTQLVTVAYDDGGTLETIGAENLVERDLPARPIEAMNTSAPPPFVPRRDRERRGPDRPPQSSPRRDEPPRDRAPMPTDNPPSGQARPDQQSQSGERRPSGDQSQPQGPRRHRRRRRRRGGGPGDSGPRGNMGGGPPSGPPPAGQ